MTDQLTDGFTQRPACTEDAERVASTLERPIGSRRSQSLACSFRILALHVAHSGRFR